MGLLSIFKRGADTPARPPVADEPAGDVQRARTRARQRLIGAAVLVAVGVIGFPLVFETQPRPISVDIPIDIPRKEGVPPLVMPAARQPRGAAVPEPAAVTASSIPVVVTPAPSPRDDVITETRDEATRAAPAASRATAGVTVPPKPATKPAEANRPAADPRPASSEDGTRAKALLEGKTPAAAATSRYVVQVGAFADASAAREARAKVERLGLKTYTQVVETPAGPRIRVRVGPFTSRDEADKARASARSAGLAAAVLAL